ncbi:MAG: hypothetical protein HN370_09755 [Phycisphaerales bacterium]|nr:hypothetical protein [Phycisphaerales bacterium]
MVKSKSKPTETKSRAGRPAGTPNSEQPVVLVEAPRCRRCGCTKLRHVKKIKQSDRPGRIGGTDKRFTKTTWTRRRCDSCNQQQIIITREYEPSAWND